MFRTPQPKHVSFSSAVDRVDIAAYSTIYGAHPNSFDFAADGRMVWRHLHNFEFGFAPTPIKFTRATKPRNTREGEREEKVGQTRCRPVNGADTQGGDRRDAATRTRLGSRDTARTGRCGASN